MNIFLVHFFSNGYRCTAKEDAALLPQSFANMYIIVPMPPCVTKEKLVPHYTFDFEHFPRFLHHIVIFYFIYVFM